MAGTPSGVMPTGTVTYSFTGTNGTSLAGTTAPPGWTVAADRSTWTETVTLTGGNVPDSAPTDSLLPGSYMFEAQYSGDANLTPSTGPPEPLAVTGPTRRDHRAAEDPLLAGHVPTSRADRRANRR